MHPPFVTPDLGGRKVVATTFLDYAERHKKLDDPMFARRIDWALKRTHNLGFSVDGYRELLALHAEATTDLQRQTTAFYLGLYHANRRGDRTHAEEALEWLSIVTSLARGEPLFLDVTILRAECEVALGELDNARSDLERAADFCNDPNLHLALANLVDRHSPHDLSRRISLALTATGISPIVLEPRPGSDLFECIAAVGGASRSVGHEPLISVIVPVFNSGPSILTALRSLQAQTWENIEVLVVDDCSTDDTRDVVDAFSKADSRFRLITAPRNGGPYVARNIALSQARGYFVTCHDADDWSHPEKLGVQARHLLENPRVIANASQQARTFPDLTFHRRENRGIYVFSNMSSLMFRREAVLERVGYWDSVRFGADSEFIRRLKFLFGRNAVVDLQSGVLCLQKQSSSSLTGNQVFGYHGYFLGARAEYREAQENYYQAGKQLKFAFPQRSRPFEVPDPLRPIRRAGNGEARHFDVIIASEFRMRGGSTRSCIEEIKAHKRLGLRTGLVQLARYDLPPIRKIVPEVRDELEEGRVELLVYGERATCDLLIVRYPPVLYRHQAYVPHIEAKYVRVIVNQTPMSDYGPTGVRRYFIPDCQENLERYFGAVAREAVWHPVGPLVRQALHEHHAEELHAIRLSEEDWVNILDVDEWDVPDKRALGIPPRIGRHARDDLVKWPADRKSLLTVYPASDKYAVHILGGASVPQTILGKLPSSWRVWDFGELSPRDFLANLDVFVYYTHPQWVESFGRVIIEAMAAGVPVVLPPAYRTVFGDAALYAPPENALEVVDELIRDRSLYARQVEKGKAEVREKYSYERHAARIRPYLGISAPAPKLDIDTRPQRTDPLTLSLLSCDAKAIVTEREQVEELACCEHLTSLAARLENDASRILLRARNSAARPAVDATYRNASASPEPAEHADRKVADDVFVLALARWITGKEEYSAHAAGLLQILCEDDASADFPGLLCGGGVGEGKAEIIDYGRLCFLLDAVRMLESTLTGKTLEALKRRLANHIDWLVASPAGKRARAATNHVGTYYDLRLGALAEYLGETKIVWQVIERLEKRASSQFDERGIQVEELALPRSAHFCCLNLQGWTTLLELAVRWGVSLTETHPWIGSRLRRARDWLIAHAGYPWPYGPSEVLDGERLWPIVLAGRLGDERDLDSLVEAACCKYQLKPVFRFDYGIRPYWNLGGRTHSLKGIKRDEFCEAQEEGVLTNAPAS